MNERYDKKGNLIYYEGSNDIEQWIEYDEYNNCIHSKYSDGYESWFKYDENNKQISITHQEFKQIERNKERRKVLFNNKRINRFSLMDI